jgi:hypothetical protein
MGSQMNSISPVSSVSLKCDGDKLLQKLVISDKCDFVVIDICTFDLDILTKVFLE